MTRGRALGGALLLAALLAAPQLASPFWDFVLCTALVYMIAALSVNVLFGQAGMVGLFPAAFLGVGAYMAAVVARETGSWLAGLGGAVAAAVALGALVGAAGTRLRGMSFGIVTLAFAVALETVAFRHGVLGIDPALGATLARPQLGGIDLLDDATYYYLVLAVGLLAWIVVAAHVRGKPGRAWRAIRDDEVAALALGLHAGRYRVWAAALAGGVGAVAGVLFISLHGQANVESFTAVQSLLIFAAALTGGTRSSAGAVVAGVLVVVVPELLHDLGVSGKLVPLLFAVGVLASLKGTDGIVGAVRDALARAGARRRAAATVPPMRPAEGAADA